jgi:hypothetical protein
MTEAMLVTILDEVQAKRDGAERTMPDGRRVTLYAAHDGVALTIGKVASLRIENGLVRARNDKGETYIVHLDDVFAASIEAGATSGGARKAGFVG